MHPGSGGRVKAARERGFALDCPPVRRRLSIALVLAACGGCGYSFDPGTWQIAQDGAPTQDNCRLLPADGSLVTARAVTTGNELHLPFELPGFAPVQLIGLFQKKVLDEPDAFTLEGSVKEAPATIEGRACTIQFGQIELSATTQGARAFAGELTLKHTLRPDQDPACPLACTARVPVRGTWQGP